MAVGEGGRKLVLLSGWGTMQLFQEPDVHSSRARLEVQNTAKAKHDARPK
jgi:hypothetical protein